MKWIIKGNKGYVAYLESLGNEKFYSYSDDKGLAKRYSGSSIDRALRNFKYNTNDSSAVKILINEV